MTAADRPGAGRTGGPHADRPASEAATGPADRRRAGATPDTTSRRGLIAGLALGVPVIAYGMRGVLVDASDTNPAELARWIVGAAVVNDLVLLPLAGVVGYALRRVSPPAAWPIVRAGALTIGVLTLVAWPFVRGYGRDPANPSLLPRDYGLGLAVVAAVVATVTAIAAVVVTRRRSRPES